MKCTPYPAGDGVGGLAGFGSSMTLFFLIVLSCLTTWVIIKLGSSLPSRDVNKKGVNFLLGVGGGGEGVWLSVTQ